MSTRSGKKWSNGKRSSRNKRIAPLIEQSFRCTLQPFYGTPTIFIRSSICLALRIVIAKAQMTERPQHAFKRVEHEKAKTGT
jgi:TctA family transporter